MSVDDQLLYESRVRKRQSIVAGAAGGLLLIAAIVGLVGPHTKVNELTLGLLTDHKRGWLDLVAGVINALAELAIASTLVFLFRCSKARRPQAMTVMPILAVIGAAVASVCAIVNPIVLHHKVAEFVSTGSQTYDEATRLTSGGLLLALQIGTQAGSLVVALAVVLISLQAMRVGLLPRVLGYVGIFAGILILFPIVVLPVVQMYWLIGIGYLLSGRWPSGVPPAWRSGQAEPWPSSSEMRARRAASAPAGGGLGEPVPAVDGPSGPTGARSPKRKRKRRN